VIWFYSDGGRQAGPVDDAGLDQLVSTGVVRADTLVWHAGLVDWAAYSTARGIPPPLIPGLADLAGTRTCAECGRIFPTISTVAIGAAWTCAECKPLYLQRLWEGGEALGGRRYGGFWVRFVARRLDGVLLGLSGWGVAMAAAAILSRAKPSTVAVSVTGFVWLLDVLIGMTYEVYFLVRGGATPGKMTLGLKVVRADGSRVSASLAAGRFFADWLSQITLGIGYLIAGFDPEKRALHDRVCGTRVIDMNPVHSNLKQTR